MLLTVPQAARKIGRNPETIRRWIRSGRLKAQKVGRQNLIEERNLVSLRSPSASAKLPQEWQKTFDDGPQLDWVSLVHQSRKLN